MDVDSDSDIIDTELYDLELLLEGQSGGNRATSDNELPDLPADMYALRAELTPVAWITNPPCPPQHVHVPDSYSPATLFINQPPQIIVPAIALIGTLLAPC